MDDLIFLAHRLPFPPDKGDKIRSWRMLSHLAERFRVHLGAFVDDKRDAAHVGELRRICASLYCPPLNPVLARLKSAAALFTGQSLTERYFHDRRMARWVAATMVRARPSFRLRLLLGDGALSHALSLHRQHHRHGRRRFREVAAIRGPKPLPGRYPLPPRGRRGAGRSNAARLLVSIARCSCRPPKRSLFLKRAPEAADRVLAVGNGVDLDRFNPDRSFANPYAQGTRAVVFTGAMDYRPNIDAVLWFAASVMPLLRGRVPGLEFWIVGSNPASAVCRLAQAPDIRVTGRVPDIRPYLAAAFAAVAPLRIARGIQNKVLEAMAMGKPVVASPQALEGISLKPGEEALVASSPEDFAASLLRVWRGAEPGMGARARARVEADYRWEAKLAALDALYEDSDMAAQRRELRAHLHVAGAS